MAFFFRKNSQWTQRYCGKIIPILVCCKYSIFSWKTWCFYLLDISLPKILGTAVKVVTLVLDKNDN